MIYKSADYHSRFSIPDTAISGGSYEWLVIMMDYVPWPWSKELSAW